MQRGWRQPPTPAHRVCNVRSLTVLCELRPSLSASACHMARSRLDRQDGRLRMALQHSTARHSTQAVTLSSQLTCCRTDSSTGIAQPADHVCIPFCVLAVCFLLSGVCCLLPAICWLLLTACCLCWLSVAPCVPLGEVLTALPAGLPEPTQQLLDLITVRARWAGQAAGLYRLQEAAQQQQQQRFQHGWC